MRVCLGGMLGIAMTTDSLPSRVFVCHRVFLDLKAPSDHLVKKYVFWNCFKIMRLSEFFWQHASKLSMSPIKANQFNKIIEVPQNSFSFLNQGNEF